VGGEHHAERGQRDVERAVGVREGLGVRGLEGDVEPVGLGAPLSLVEKRGNVVGRGHVREAPRGRERGVAVAGRDVEDALAGVDVGRLAERLAHDLEADADLAVVPLVPGRLLAGLDGRVVDGRNRDGVHVVSFRMERR